MKIFKIFILCFIASCGNNQNSNQHDSEWIKQLESQKQIQENSKGWLDSGNREFSQGNYINAIQSYNKAISVNSKNIEAYLGRASAKEILNDYGGAMEDYNEIIKIDSQRVDVYWLRAHVKQNLKDHTGAKEDYIILLRVNTDNKTKGKYYYRALAKRELGDYHGAIKELDDNMLILIYEGYDSGYCYYLMGIWKIEIGQKEDGCRDLSQAGEDGYKKAYEAIKRYCNK